MGRVLSVCWIVMVLFFVVDGMGTGQEVQAQEGGKVRKTEEQWRQELTPGQFYILRQKGTEPAFSGRFHDHKGHGVYRCAGCGNPLFSSEAKFDSGTGWPSFWRPIVPTAVVTRADNSLFMRRTEVLCARCDGHLGHVFADGPAPTGLRYCINSAALEFKGVPPEGR